MRPDVDCFFYHNEATTLVYENMTGSLAGLRWNFSDVNQFCKDTCRPTKHEEKGFKYYNEKYVHDISGEFFYIMLFDLYFCCLVTARLQSH